MKIHNCVQGEAEWLALRIGRVTASELDQLVTPLLTERKGDMPFTYLCRKVAEAYRGKPLPEEQFYSFDTEQGQMLEDEARKFFCFTYDHERITQPGFCEHDNGYFGCSPDALIGDDNGLEIKCPKSKTHVRYLMEGKLPQEYAPQVHGSLYATGRSQWTFFSYARGFPPFCLTVERNEEYMEKINEAVTNFHSKLTDALTRLREMAEAKP